VEELVKHAVQKHLQRLAKRARDSLFADAAVFEKPDDGCTDVAVNHDKYLYDVDPHGDG